MLSVLHIENIAVIEQAEILFEGGFNVLTGETGAGKSIVIDAISAILGERTYRDVIRTGANRAFVSAIFTNIPQYDWFSENQVEFDPQELQVQREIYADGQKCLPCERSPGQRGIAQKARRQTHQHPRTARLAAAV